ncbi:MAG: O-antigen ligase family protein [Pseudomonadota bacterium]
MQNIKQQLTKIKSDDLMFVCIALTFFLLPTGTAPPLMAICLVFLAWVFSGKVAQVKDIVKQPWFWPIIPFVVLPWVGLLYSQNMELGLDYAGKTKYWLAVVLTASVSFDEKRTLIIIKCLWAGLSIGALLAGIQFFGILPPVKESQLGFGIVHTLINMYLIIGVLTASFGFKNAESNKSKIILFILILLFSFHIAVSIGRAGYLVFAILSPFVASNLMHGFSFKIKMIVSILFACSLLLSPTVRGTLKTTIMIFDNQKENIFKGEDIEALPRPFIYKEAIKIIIEHPVIGIGTGSLTEPTKAKGHLVNHPHNNFLYMGVSYGLIGMLSCFWLFWNMFKRSWRMRKTRTGYFIFSSCVVLFLGGLFDTQILNTGTLLFLSLSYGMLNHLQKE